MTLWIRAALFFALFSSANFCFALPCEKALISSSGRHATIDPIISYLDKWGKIDDCGQGCFEYSDSSSYSIPIHQRESERSSASKYAKSILRRGEGILLLSRFQGYDIPAYDGLIYQINTGNIVARVSIKSGYNELLLIEHGFVRAHEYSAHGGKWENLARQRSRGLDGNGRKLEMHINAYRKIGEIFLVDSRRIKTRIVLDRRKEIPIEEESLALTKRLLMLNADRSVESVTYMTGDHVQVLR